MERWRGGCAAGEGAGRRHHSTSWSCERCSGRLGVCKGGRVLPCAGYAFEWHVATRSLGRRAAGHALSARDPPTRTMDGGEGGRVSGPAARVAGGGARATTVQLPTAACRGARAPPCTPLCTPLPSSSAGGRPAAQAHRPVWRQELVGHRERHPRALGQELPPQVCARPSRLARDTPFSASTPGAMKPPPPPSHPTHPHSLTPHHTHSLCTLRAGGATSSTPT